jgi:O-acetyl-ADP-ribose deacetylase (regulator of RNase III)
MKTVKGDLIKLAKKGEFDVIIHGCNCFCAMGSGIALQIKREFPGAYKVDMQTKQGDRKKLGTYSKAILGDLTVINAYTQYDFKGTGILADYKAIDKVFRSIAIDFEGKRIGFPMIGAGLARGNWEEIEAIIKNNLGGMCDFTLVEYQP